MTRMICHSECPHDKAVREIRAYIYPFGDDEANISRLDALLEEMERILKDERKKHESKHSR